MKRRLWNNWEVIDMLGKGSYAEVYKAVKKVDGIPLYCAVKYISLPKLETATKDAVKNTDKIIANLKQEINIIQRLNGDRNILNYLNFHQEPSEDKKGVDCYIYIPCKHIRRASRSSTHKISLCNTLDRKVKR